MQENAKMLDLARALLTKEQAAKLGEIRLAKTPDNPKIFLELLQGLTETGVDGNT